MRKLKFFVSLLTKDNHYQRQQEAAARDAGRRLGIDIDVLYSASDAINQSEQLLKAIQSPKDSRPDAILCCPAGTTLLQVARHAATAGVGWAILNRECDYVAELRKSHQVAVFSIATDNEEVGRLQGRQISTLLPEGGLVLYILGPTVSSITHLRSTHMHSAKPCNVQVRTLIGNWTEDSGHQAVSRWLQLSTSHTTPVSLVAGQNDDMAMGARKAFEDETHGEERHRWTSLPYIGVDCCPGTGQEWVRQGLLTASVINPPTCGVAVELMAKAIETKSQPLERTVIPPVSFPPIDKLMRKPTP